MHWKNSKATVKRFKWFLNNRLNSNIEKWNLITSSLSQVEIPSDKATVFSLSKAKLLGIHIDGRLDITTT